MVTGAFSGPVVQSFAVTSANGEVYGLQSTGCPVVVGAAVMLAVAVAGGSVAVAVAGAGVLPWQAVNISANTPNNENSRYGCLIEKHSPKRKFH